MIKARFIFHLSYSPERLAADLSATGVGGPFRKTAGMRSFAHAGAFCERKDLPNPRKLGRQLFGGPIPPACFTSCGKAR